MMCLVFILQTSYKYYLRPNSSACEWSPEGGSNGDFSVIPFIFKANYEPDSLFLTF